MRKPINAIGFLIHPLAPPVSSRGQAASPGGPVARVARQPVSGRLAPVSPHARIRPGSPRPPGQPASAA